MKYTPELTAKIVLDYENGVSAEDIAASISTPNNVVPVRSVRAKLSSLGIYTKKSYVNKRGELPIKKNEYVDRIAVLLDVSSEILESLEKVNKNVLALIEKKLQKSQQM